MASCGAIELILGDTMLTAEKVHTVIIDCLFREGEDTTDHIPVSGVVLNLGFHPGRLKEHTDEIAELLAELPEGFSENMGGGRSFLDACMDKHGEQWGEHRNVDELLTLGLASGLVSYCLPREVWHVLPGGMPYFTVHKL